MATRGSPPPGIILGNRIVSGRSTPAWRVLASYRHGKGCRLPRDRRQALLRALSFVKTTALLTTHAVGATAEGLSIKLRL